jgi:hypothetical protein
MSKRATTTSTTMIVCDRAIAWLRERLQRPGGYWSPAERRLGNAVAKLTEEDHEYGISKSFLVMPAKPKPRAGTRTVPRRKGV